MIYIREYCFVLQGRQVWAMDKVQPNSITRIGDGWKGGVYFAAILQGDQRKTIKLIKEN